MAKGCYIGDSNNKARKVKKMYIGDANGVARKVKKVYIGDANNKARLCWSGSLGITVLLIGSSLYYTKDNNTFALSRNNIAPSNSSYSRVTYGNNRFIATFPTTNALEMWSSLFYSLDGISWTVVGQTLILERLYNTYDRLSIKTVFINGYFVICFYAAIGYSSDGVNWNVTPLPVDSSNNYIKHTNAVYHNGTYLVTSASSIVFKGSSLSNLSIVNSNALADARLCSNESVLVGYSTGYGIFTADINSLTVTTRLGIYNSACYGIAYGNGRFILALGSNIYYSLDGYTWTLGASIYLTSISFDGSKFIAINVNYNFAYSFDGVAWTTVPTNVSASIISVAGNM